MYFINLDTMLSNSPFHKLLFEVYAIFYSFLFCFCILDNLLFSHYQSVSTVLLQILLTIFHQISFFYFPKIYIFSSSGSIANSISSKYLSLISIFVLAPPFIIPRKAGYCHHLRESVYLFVCLFVCLLAGFLINYWSDFDEI